LNLKGCKKTDFVQDFMDILVCKHPCAIYAFTCNKSLLPPTLFSSLNLYKEHPQLVNENVIMDDS
jgi:hypothetical protein